MCTSASEGAAARRPQAGKQTNFSLFSSVVNSLLEARGKTSKAEGILRQRLRLTAAPPPEG